MAFSECSTDSEHSHSFAPGTATSAAVKAKAAAAQVSLIDFDFDDAPSPAAASSSANPMDDLAGLGALSLGPSQPAPPAQSQPAQQNAGSLFDLDSSAFSAPPSNGGYNVPASVQAPTSTGGSFFSNPSYGNGLGSARASSNGSPATASIPWSTTATNASSSRSSTPGMATMGAAIQLPGSRPGSAAPVPPPTESSPWDSMAAFGHQQSQQRGAPPPPPKDAFEDLLL